jgi:uncharacterized repeat protein (TIGR03843 family)
VPADELTLLREGEVEVLGRMPWGSNATLLTQVCHRDRAGQAVYKPRRGERPLWDFPNGLDRREVAAYELSEALGWGLVPETVLRDDLPHGVGSLQRFVPFQVEEHYFSLYEDEAHHDRLRTICCFDLLTNQTDRKSGHCLLAADGDRIWAVDNALSVHVEPKLRTVIWEFGGEPIPDDLRADAAALVEKGLPPELCALIDAEEQAALLRRARAVARDGSRFPIDGSGRAYPWPLV